MENYLCTCSALPILSCIPNLKSVAQVAFEILRSKCIRVTSLTFQGMLICLIVCQKFRGHVTSHTPFGESYLSVQSAFNMRISYWLNLKSVAQIIFKIFGIVCHKIYRSRDLGHAPFGDNYLIARSAFLSRSGVSNLMSLAQVVFKICSIVCQKLRGHVT